MSALSEYESRWVVGTSQTVVTFISEGGFQWSKESYLDGQIWCDNSKTSLKVAKFMKDVDFNVIVKPDSSQSPMSKLKNGMELTL